MATDDDDVALAFTRSEGGDIVACEPKEGLQLRPSDPHGRLAGDDGRTLRGPSRSRGPATRPLATSTMR